MILILPLGEFLVELIVEVPSRITRQDIDVRGVRLLVLFAGDLDNTLTVHPVLTRLGSNMTEDRSGDAI